MDREMDLISTFYGLTLNPRPKYEGLGMATRKLYPQGLPLYTFAVLSSGG